jgi:hypothetical protein
MISEATGVRRQANRHVTQENRRLVTGELRQPSVLADAPVVAHRRLRTGT